MSATTSTTLAAHPSAPRTPGGDAARRTLDELLAPHALREVQGGGTVAHFHEVQLTSVYQPIVAAADGRLYAAEAYVRTASAGAPQLSPWSLFAQAGSGEEVVRLDRLCRALHVANFGAGFAHGAKLFLNVHPDLPEVVKADFGLSFRRILALLGVAPERCVLELRVGPQSSQRLLRDVVRGFRARGFGVALDLGVGPAQAAPFTLETLGVWPDYLKFTPASEVDVAFAPLRRARAEGVQLVATRLGSRGSVALARALGADYLQGHAIAPASSEAPPLRPA